MAEHHTGALLGQLLVASGAITEDELLEALRRQPLSGRPLGQLLIEMGALAPRQLERALRAQARLRGREVPDAKLVLVVDDDPEIGTLLADVLMGSGYRVGVAEDAEAALAALTAPGGARPAVILLDLGLPGMSGVELLQIARQDPALARIPVLVLTGRPDLSAEVERQGLVIGQILSKPISSHRLLMEVGRALDRTTPEAVVPGG